VPGQHWDIDRNFDGEGMKVLLLGANGYLGPHVVNALESGHELRITDIRPPREKTRHEYMYVDISSIEQVRKAARGMDAIVNLSVLRSDRKLAFDVNTRGCYNMMLAAVEQNIRRVINTGPHLVVSGPPSERFDFRVGPDQPPQPGTHLYGLSKSLGQEICRVFAQHHDVYVQEYLFFSLLDAGKLTPGTDATPFSVSWGDAGAVFRLGLEIDLAKLPSRCEIFFVFSDMPHGKFINEKAKRVLDFRPKDDLSILWRKPV
jgi:NAD dependent epimerase/dehydratase family